MSIVPSALYDVVALEEFEVEFDLVLVSLTVLVSFSLALLLDGFLFSLFSFVSLTTKKKKEKKISSINKIEYKK